MPKTMKECIATVEKQIELALSGFQTELDAAGVYLEDDLSLGEKRKIVANLHEATEAIDDLFEQLCDMRSEEQMMKEVLG